MKGENYMKLFCENYNLNGLINNLHAIEIPII